MSHRPVREPTSRRSGLGTIMRKYYLLLPFTNSSHTLHSTHILYNTLLAYSPHPPGPPHTRILFYSYLTYHLTHLTHIIISLSFTNVYSSKSSFTRFITDMKDFINQNQNDLNQFPGSPEGDHMSVYSPGATPQHMYSYPPQTPPYAAPYYTSNSSLNSDMSDNSCHSSTVSQVSNASSYNSLTA